MTKEEAKLFIKEMKKIDKRIWKFEDVLDVFSGINLQDAIDIRKKELEMFKDVDKKIRELNIKNY